MEYGNSKPGMHLAALAAAHHGNPKDVIGPGQWFTQFQLSSLKIVVPMPDGVVIRNGYFLLSGKGIHPIKSSGPMSTRAHLKNVMI
jgi:hypothetical protein